MSSHPTLSPEQWRRAQDLFHSAVDLGPDQRRALLDASDAEPVVRAEAESLLAASGEGPVAPLDDNTPLGLAPGTTIGPYVIEHALGEGGMGVVYRAQREGAGFRQTVALKLLRHDVSSPVFENRMVEERSILARLEHPGIARMIDGGTTDNGQPYIAMEFVEGQDLLSYCDQRSLSVRDRLSIFLDVCAAVDYAHQQLIVHRDIKPNNILVASGGDAKLLDFGVAKLLHTTQGFDEHHTGHWLTPAYASPEQVMGDRLGTLSDEYALGVLLYELLTGQRPYDMNTADRDSIMEAVCETDPPPMSANVPDETIAALRGATVEGLRRALAGDLDAIVKKALAKSPADRYPSVLALSEDLKRHLDAFPVVARPATPIYRLKRLMARHRTAALAVGIGAISLVGGVGASLWQARRATRQAELAAIERTRAQDQAAKASLITSLMVDLFQLSDPTNVQGDTLTAREILDRGTDRIVRDFGDQPDVQAAVLSEVAKVYANLGLFERSEELVRRSLEITGDLYGTNSPEASERLAQLGWILVQQGRAEEAASYYRQTIRLRETSVDLPDSLVSAAKAELAWLLREMRQYDEAAQLFSEALEEQRTMFGDERSDVASTLLGLASTFHDQGSFDEAEALFDRALTRYDTTGSRPHPAAADALMNIGLIRRLREQYASAEPLTRRGTEMTTALYDRDHPAVLIAEAQYAALLYDLGRYPEAKALLERALDFAVTSLGPMHNRTTTIRHTLASIHNAMGDYAMSAAQFDTVLTIQRLDYGEHPQVVFTLFQSGNPFIDMGDLARAEARLQESLDMGFRVSGERSVYRALSLLGMARIHQQRGQLDLALRTVEEARTLAESQLSRDTHRYLLYADRVRADILLARGEYAAVPPLMQFGLDVLSGKFEEHRDIGRTLYFMARAHDGMGNTERALQLVNQSLPHFNQLPAEHRYPTAARQLQADLASR